MESTGSYNVLDNNWYVNLSRIIVLLLFII